MAASHLIYLGTYTRSGWSKGIYSIRLDGATGALSTPMLAAKANDPGWIILSPDKRFLFAIHASPGQAISYHVDPEYGSLTPVDPASTPPRAAPPSHLAVDATGRVLLAANYAVGYVAAMSIHPDGMLGKPNLIRHEGRSVHPTRQDKPHVHSVTPSPDNRHVIVADLGLDRVYSYALDLVHAVLTPGASPFVATAPGAGPRHFKFGPSGQQAYGINELGNTIVAYDFDARTGALIAKQTVATLPDGYREPSTTAEIRVHPNGRFLYGSNRGHDSIAVFAINPPDGILTPVEIIPTGGKTPRNFALSPDGRWLVCGHQDTDLLTVFAVDAATGRLTRTVHTAVVPTCICVLFYD